MTSSEQPTKPFRATVAFLHSSGEPLEPVGYSCHPCLLLRDRPWDFQNARVVLYLMRKLLKIAFSPL